MKTGLELTRVQQGHTYSGITNLTGMVCPECGVTYAIPTALQQAARAAGHRKITWYCPNGHNLGYNDNSKAELEAERLASNLQWERDRAGRLSADLDQTKARLSAQKGATTRAKRRHAAALCPCCNRSFVQLRRHMEAKHPDYKPEP